MDAKLHSRVAIHNIISAISIGGIAILVIFCLGAIFGYDPLELIDNETNYRRIFDFIVILPILFIGCIIMNVSAMNYFISKNIEIYSKTNNINLDFEFDLGDTPHENRAFFPYNPKIYELAPSMSFDLIKSGEFEDLGFSYSVDDFRCQCKAGHLSNDKTIYSKTGVVTNFVFNKNINEVPIVISSKSFDKKSYKKNNILSEFFIPALKGYNRETYKTVQELMIFSKNNEFHRYKQLLVSHEIFKKEFHMIINKKTVSIFTPEDKFKIKVPIILTKNKLEKIISNEKGRMYDFNTYLYDLAFIFKDI